MSAPNHRLGGQETGKVLRGTRDEAVESSLMKHLSADKFQKIEIYQTSSSARPLLLV